jgi:DNA-binding protein HU-beta
MLIHVRVYMVQVHKLAKKIKGYRMCLKIKPFIIRRIKMNKSEFIKEYARQTGESQVRSKQLLEKVFEIVAENVEKEDVRMLPFGTFKLVTKKARTGRNPQTGKSIKIKAKKVVEFKISKAFKNQFNKKTK